MRSSKSKKEEAALIRKISRRENRNDDEEEKDARKRHEFQLLCMERHSTRSNAQAYLLPVSTFPISPERGRPHGLFACARRTPVREQNATTALATTECVRGYEKENEPTDRQKVGNQPAVNDERKTGKAGRRQGVRSQGRHETALTDDVGQCWLASANEMRRRHHQQMRLLPATAAAAASIHTKERSGAAPSRPRASLRNRHDLIVSVRQKAIF